MNNNCFRKISLFDEMPYVKKYANSSSILLASSKALLSILADAGGLLRIINLLPVLNIFIL
jgi:hypothetical protein